MINYKQTYYELISILHHFNVHFYDPKIYGPGVAFTFNDEINGAIAIDGCLSTKNKIFVILHEIGHLFYFKHELILRKHSGNEQQANDTACQILSEIEPKLIKEYEQYYKKINNREYIYGKKKELQQQRARPTKKTQNRKQSIKKRS